MSLTKKRKSDAHIDQAVANPKKEKWYNEEQKMKMLSAASIEANEPTRRRSSFMGALKRMVSGSSMKDKTRSKLTAAQLPSSTSNFKENENSFASETSHESENHLPVDKLVNNCDLRRFVQTGEAPTEKADMSIETTSSDAFDTTISSNSVLFAVTPVRGFRRDTNRRPSCRSMPESSSIDALALTGVRRHSSSVSTEHSIASPVTRSSRLSFRLFKGRHSTSMADLPENSELNMSFAPLAEADEDFNAITPEQHKKESNLIRTASRLFGSGKKRTTIATPNEISSISTNTNGEDSFNTPTNTSLISRTSPTSSGIQKRVSNAFNMLRFKASPPIPRSNRVQRSKTENPKKDHRIRKRTEVNPRRSTCHNMSFAEIMKEQELQKEKAGADRFRQLVCIADEPIPVILKKMDFDAILVDINGGKPASAPASAVLEHYQLTGNVQAACTISDEGHILLKTETSPLIVCVKMEEHALKPLEVRVRSGVGKGLRAAWEHENVSRILAYPMCFNEREWNDTEKCIEQFFNMVLNALEWDKKNKNIEYVMLAGVTPQHVQLIKERFDLFLAKLPVSNSELKKDETDVYPL